MKNKCKKSFKYRKTDYLIGSLWPRLRRMSV